MRRIGREILVIRLECQPVQSASSVQFIIELTEDQSKGLTMKGSSGVPVCVYVCVYPVCVRHEKKG